jgi:hypothetical protein
VNDVAHLVVSSSIDYSTDLVCCEFERRGLSYLRINRDCFSEYRILHDLQTDTLTIGMGDDTFLVTPDSLRSVYFRAPTFLRNMGKSYSLQEQLYRSQWGSFIRNLIHFECARWVNHPVATYGAENKVFQLSVARRCGVAVPNTHVGNILPHSIEQRGAYVVKSLDTALFYDRGQEMFTYSTMVNGEELLNAELKAAPVIIQEYLQNKTDIRVTIVGDILFPVAITDNGCPIDGDWRKTPRENLRYRPIELPATVRTAIKRIMHILGLRFGGMDLALVDGVHYFIEVNPTGEWGWLISSARLPIDKAIVDFLSAESPL